MTILKRICSPNDNQKMLTLKRKKWKVNSEKEICKHCNYEKNNRILENPKINEKDISEKRKLKQDNFEKEHLKHDNPERGTRGRWIPNMTNLKNIIFEHVNSEQGHVRKQIWKMTILKRGKLKKGNSQKGTSEKRKNLKMVILERKNLKTIDSEHWKSEK